MEKLFQRHFEPSRFHIFGHTEGTLWVVKYHHNAAGVF